MKIQEINSKKISFKRQLTPKELNQYQATLKEAKEKTGNNGKSVLIVHDACLPQSVKTNTGVGNLNTSEAQNFFKFMKSYLNINAIEVLPSGELSPLADGKFFCAYSSSALSLSPHQINLLALTKPEYGSILKQEEFDEVVKANILQDKAKTVNYENVVTEESSFNQALKQAFKRFLTMKETSPLKKEFEQYKTENASRLEPKVLFKALEKEYGHNHWTEWDEIDRTLTSNNSEASKKRIDFLRSKYKNEAEFYKFKQFIAQKHLQEARKNLNKMGLKLIGDCLVGFSNDEQWAYQKAFNFDYSIGWGLPAYNYDEITDPNSQAAKLLKQKVQFFAKNYDSIRFDVSWSYVEPHIIPNAHVNTKPYAKRVNFESQLLEKIEGYVKEIKGDDFDVKDLIHEFDAEWEDFQSCENGKWRSALQGRTKALGTTYMDNQWGSNKIYLKLNNGTPNFILGAGNHDPQPLRQIAYSIPDLDGRIHKTAQIQPLSELFEIPPAILENPIEFIKYKFAEVMTAKNNQYFYMDVFGREERFDSQQNNTYMNYRQKIPFDFEKSYIEALESGHGFNPMDSMEKIFKLNNLDKLEPKLYASILKFRNILLEKTPQIKEKRYILRNTLIASACFLIGGLLAFWGDKTSKKPASNITIRNNFDNNRKPIYKDFI